MTARPAASHGNSAEDPHIHFQELSRITPTSLMAHPLLSTGSAMKCLAAAALALTLSSTSVFAQTDTTLLVSVPDQRMVVVQNGLRVAQFGVSTSKFGLSDKPRSYGTPLGTLQIAEKIGDGAPEGAVFKSRRPTGEVIRPNAQGRDPIVTRILRLRGLEGRNCRALDRGIYIH